MDERNRCHWLSDNALDNALSVGDQLFKKKRFLQFFSCDSHFLKEKLHPGKNAVFKSQLLLRNVIFLSKTFGEFNNTLHG